MSLQELPQALEFFLREVILNVQNKQVEYLKEIALQGGWRRVADCTRQMLASHRQE
jgi:hypothetical protein